MKPDRNLIFVCTEILSNVSPYNNRTSQARPVLSMSGTAWKANALLSQCRTNDEHNSSRGDYRERSHERPLSAFYVKVCFSLVEIGDLLRDEIEIARFLTNSYHTDGG